MQSKCVTKTWLNFSPLNFLTQRTASCIQRMVVEELTEEEQELAANTSYAYWASVQLSRQPVKECPSASSVSTELVDNDTRIWMAMREARRHFVGEGGHYENAVRRFKNALQWRKVRAYIECKLVTDYIMRLTCRVLTNSIVLSVYTRSPK